MGSETTVARAGLVWLTDNRWDVYQEVPFGGCAADLVGTLGSLVCVVEAKRSLTFDVIAQAVRWLPHAHLVWALVPYARRSDGRILAEEVCREHGVGLLLTDDRDGYRVAERVRPRPQRRADSDALRAALRPEHKTHLPAGSGSGGRYTPFVETCQRLRSVVAQRPGVAIGEAIGALVKHHYASDTSARASLTHWIAKGKVPGLRVERDGKTTRLYPSEAPHG